MKLMLSLIAAAALAVTPPANDPECSTSITIPQSSLEVRIDYRQIGTDTAPFLETSGMSLQDLRRLQVKSALAQRAYLRSDVSLTVGEETLAPGRYPIGFTVGASGLHVFLAVGEKCVPLMGEPVTPGWKSPRFLLQLVYASRTDLRLMWHLDEKAGVIKLGLGPAPVAGPGAEVAPADAGATAPPDEEPAAPPGESGPAPTTDPAPPADEEPKPSSPPRAGAAPPPPGGELPKGS